MHLNLYVCIELTCVLCTESFILKAEAIPYHHHCLINNFIRGWGGGVNINNLWAATNWVWHLVIRHHFVHTAYITPPPGPGWLGSGSYGHVYLPTIYACKRSDPYKTTPYRSGCSALYGRINETLKPDWSLSPSGKIKRVQKSVFYVSPHFG